MAVRTGFAGTTAVGDVLTSANITSLPGGWIGYAEVTAAQTGITTVTALTSLTVTVTVGANRKIKITGSGVFNPPTVADGWTSGYIQEGATVLGYWGIHYRNATTNAYERQQGSVVSGGQWAIPSAGTHTYKLTLERSSGTGTVGLYAAVNAPAFILVEDLGPA